MQASTEMNGVGSLQTAESAPSIAGSGSTAAVDPDNVQTGQWAAGAVDGLVPSGDATPSCDTQMMKKVPDVAAPP